MIQLFLYFLAKKILLLLITNNTIKNFVINKINKIRLIIPKKYRDKNIEIKVRIKS